jgi:hypothetical protein
VRINSKSEQFMVEQQQGHYNVTAAAVFVWCSQVPWSCGVLACLGMAAVQTTAVETNSWSESMQPEPTS